VTARRRSGKRSAPKRAAAKRRAAPHAATRTGVRRAAPRAKAGDALAGVRGYRERPTHLVVGLMSGTSADGVDAVLARIDGDGVTRPPEVVAHRSFPFDAAVRAEILDLAASDLVAPERLMRLGASLGELYAAAVLELAAASGTDPATLDAIGMHGQTVRHVPRHEGRGALSLQVGSAAIVAERTGVAVVSDFRPRDTAAGGEGAPLVPFADWCLFRSDDESRVLLNLGGMANLTHLPKRAGLEDVIAFDTGPGNAVLDALVRTLTEGERLHDEGGAMAARGTVHEGLLEELLADPFFAQPPPRSTGRERFGVAYAESLLRAGRGLGLGDADVLATATGLTSASVALAIARYVRPRGAVDRVLVSGGGVRNATIVNGLRVRLAPAAVEPLDALGVAAEAKEALAFALLAHRTLRGEPGNVPGATGAARFVVLGTITPGRTA